MGARVGWPFPQEALTFGLCEWPCNLRPCFLHNGAERCALGTLVALDLGAGRYEHRLARKRAGGPELRWGTLGAGRSHPVREAAGKVYGVPAARPQGQAGHLIHRVVTSEPGNGSRVTPCLSPSKRDAG